MSTSFPTSTPIWTRRIANELWSGPVTPLTYALLAEPMAEHLVRRPLRVAGLEKLAGHPVLRCHASHVYVNATVLAGAIRLLPGGLLSEGLLDLLPAAAHSEIGAGSSWLTGGAQAVTIALRAWTHDTSWAPWARAAAFDRECLRVRHEFENWGTFGAKPSTVERVTELVRVRERLGAYLDVVSWGVVFAYVFYHLAHELSCRWAPGLETERAALTVGLPGIVSLDAHRELRDLGILAAAARTPPRDVEVAAAGFLARHGHRLTGRDLSCPTWRESPAMVLELARSECGVAGVAAFDPVAASRRRHAATHAVERAFGRGPAALARRALFRLVLSYAQRYYALRENMRYHADFFLARMREIALAEGTALAARGQLAARDDVFWLDLDELAQAGAADRALGARATERRAAWIRDAAVPPPDTLGEPPVTTIDAPAGGRTLRGIVGAPGRCRGRARLVHGPADFARVAAGDVLIAVYTDPGWTPVLERAAGLVLEAGGLLSHGAIVAREIGIPALVEVVNATRTIANDDTVELDTATGTVTIVSAAVSVSG